MARKPKLVKIPFELVKRMADGAGGEQNWQIHIPEQYQNEGAASLEPHKGSFFILLGPYESEEEIQETLK